MSLDRKDRYFLTVATAGSLRKASQELNVSSSAISRFMALLEDDLGVPLFDRVAQGMILTTEGTLYLQHVRSMMQEVERVRAELGAISGLEKGHIRLASVQGLASELIMQTNAAFLRAHPKISLELTIADSDNVIAAIRNRDADLGVSVSAGMEDDLGVILSITNPIVAVMAPSHELATSRTLQVKAIVRDYPVALLAHGFGLRRYVDSCIGELKRPAFESNSLDMLKKFAELQCGIALLPKLAVRAEIAAGGLTGVRLSDSALEASTLDFSLLKGRTMPTSVSKYVAVLRSTASDLGIIK